MNASFELAIITRVIQSKNKQYPTYWLDAEAYSVPFQTSKMECFAEIVNSFQSLSILAKRSVLFIWQGSEYTSVMSPKTNFLADGESDEIFPSQIILSTVSNCFFPLICKLVTFNIFRFFEKRTF